MNLKCKNIFEKYTTPNTENQVKMYNTNNKYFYTFLKFLFTHLKSFRLHLYSSSLSIFYRLERAPTASRGSRCSCRPGQEVSSCRLGYWSSRLQYVRSWHCIASHSSHVWRWERPGQIFQSPRSLWESRASNHIWRQLQQWLDEQSHAFLQAHSDCCARWLPFRSCLEVRL